LKSVAERLANLPASERAALLSSLTEAEAEALVVYFKPLVWLLRPELH